MKGLKIACLNINSLSKHIDELRIIMLNNSLDILTINETKINESVLDDEINISGFHLIRKDRNSYGGGVLMYIRETIPFSERNDLLTACSLEILCVEISRPCSKPFLVSTWYRPPGSVTRLFDDFETFLRRCDLENKELLLMGDLNCDVSKSPPDAHTRRLLFLSCIYQFEQLINEPTRVTRTSATLIDLIFTNKKENIIKSGVIHLGISDHSLILPLKFFNSELYKAKKSYFHDKFEVCAQTKDPKQSWHHINHLLGKNYKSNNIPQLIIGDTIVSDNLLIAEAFNDFFVSIGPKLSAEIDHARCRGLVRIRKSRHQSRDSIYPV